jgi:hypothetical protein
MEGGVTPADTEGPKAPEIAELRAMYRDAMDLTEFARRQAEIDDDYYNGNQLTREEKAELSKRGQPDIVINRVRPAVNGTLGVLKQGATDPRAYPRTPKDEDSADVASKVLQFIADKNRFDDLKISVARDYLIRGTCAAIVEADEDLQITMQEIASEEFFADPRSRREDFSDARYMGIAKWQYADDVIRMYPDAKTDVEGSLTDSGALIDDLNQDRPQDASSTVSWVDKKKRRVMVVEMYHREGSEWRRCVFHSGGTLAYGVSPYVDDKKRPCNPIVAQSCYIDRDNNRYGIVRDMRGPQDEINKRRSKLLHLINASQIQAVDPSAVEVDSGTARKEAARPDGVIPYGWQKVPTTDMAAGQANLLVEAKMEIERIGPNPAVLGREGENASGRANLVRQQAGLTEQAIVYGGVEIWELRVYEQMWNRARQFWTAPQYVRVTDDEGAPQFVGINQPKVAQGPDGQPMADMMGQPIILGYENSLAEMDVDIILDTTPNTANVAQEQFAVMAELAKVYGPQAVPFELMVSLSSLPGKREIMDKMKSKADESGQAQQQVVQLQQQMVELEAQLKQAEIANKQANTELTQAKTETEMHRAALGDRQQSLSEFNAQMMAEKAQFDAMNAAAGQQTGVPQGQA